MKIYISGMITGLKHDQYRKKFKEAAEYIREQGHEPVDPSELGKPEQRSWEYYMRRAIPQLCECDSIYMLEGWHRSKGAMLELHIAKGLNMYVIEQSSDNDLDTGNYGQQETV